MCNASNRILQEVREMKKAKYYTLDNILKMSARFMLLLGERSNGKSYAVKKRSIERAYNNAEKFVYMRRWREDIVGNGAEDYFNDMEIDDSGNERVKEITGGEYDCISVYRKDIFLAKRDEQGKKVRGMHIGKVVVLTGDTHEKSKAYVGYYRIIFEEVITKSGYLADEVAIFMSLVSTILRRKEGEVFLIGNTLTKQCPFFREWQLVNVPKQKQGTIDIYKHDTGEIDEDGIPIIITIAVEYCANTKGVTKMIFGNKMITSGIWESDNKEHLPYDYGEYERHLSILIDDELELFVIDLLSYEREPFLYVREDIRKWTNYDRFDIIITDRFRHDRRFVKSLSAFPKVGMLCKRLFDGGKVTYQDNLIGTSFDTLMNNRKIF